MNLEDPAVQYALSQMIVDPEFMWIFEFPEDGKPAFPSLINCFGLSLEKLQCLENMVKDSVFNHVKEYYKNNKSSPSQAPASQPKAPEPEPAQADQLETVREEVGDPFAEWDGS